MRFNCEGRVARDPFGDLGPPSPRLLPPTSTGKRTNSGEDRTLTMDLYPSDKHRQDLYGTVGMTGPKATYSPINEVENGNRRRGRSLVDILLRRPLISWTTAALLSLCLVLWTWQPMMKTAAGEPTRKTNGYTDVVAWDNYTLWIHDQRVFLTQALSFLRISL